MDTEVTSHFASFAELDASMLYHLLKLRTDVFVVEQADPYPELDGRDTEPETLHVWLTRADELVAYARLLDEPDGSLRIGRVLVIEHARGGGLAGELMTAVLRHVGNRRCVLDAQAYLTDFYARYGFTPTGPVYIDGTIPHVPMSRPEPIEL
jgi:ElaA protein